MNAQLHKNALTSPFSACQTQRHHRMAKNLARRLARVRGFISNGQYFDTHVTVNREKNFAIMMKDACYNMKRLTYLQRAGIEPFFYPKVVAWLGKRHFEMNK